jgi:GNAT superfamily N-acetyltransferase
MAIEIKKVVTRKELKKFVDFQYRLYKGNKYWCPQVRLDELRTLDKKKNLAFDYCEAEYWLAYRDGKIVGRIAGIINHRANKRWSEDLVRFGWIDFIDDMEVSRKLIDTVEEWGRSKGMVAGIHGPLGFTDMDNEGMLVDGFEELACLTGIYNYPYYPVHMEALGFVKAADWLQHEFPIPGEIPEKVLRSAEIVLQRYKIHPLAPKKAKDLLPYARKMWTMLNQAFDKLYGFAAISEAQMDAYTKQYFGFIRPEFVSLLIDEKDDVVGFGISLPNLTYALQKCNGYLFPFGFIHLLRAIRKNDIVDMYLVGVRPDFHGKGVTALIFNELHKAYIKHGVRLAVSSNQLEENAKAITIWKNFENRQHIRHRCYVRHFSS